MGGARRLHLGHLLAVCAEAAEVAGRHVREVWRAGGGAAAVAKNKDSGGGFDPCTAADLRAQATIFNHLLAVWPGLNVVGEEEAEDVLGEAGSMPAATSVEAVGASIEEGGKDSATGAAFAAVSGHMAELDITRIRVFVDPLDGTTEYTKGRLEAVTSLIGISYDGRPIAGVLHQPFADAGQSLPCALLSERPGDDEEGEARQRLLEKASRGHSVLAIVGAGVFGLDLVPILHRRVAPLSEFVVTTTRSHASRAVLQYLQRLDADHIERVGGSGYKALRVAGGLADVFTLPNPHTSLWDTCAPEAMMVAMGGSLTDCNGELIDYSRPLLQPEDAKNKAGILAALQADTHQRVLKQLDYSRDVPANDINKS